jgi:hypothetical protein
MNACGVHPLFDLKNPFSVASEEKETITKRFLQNYNTGDLDVIAIFY